MHVFNGNLTKISQLSTEKNTFVLALPDNKITLSQLVFGLRFVFYLQNVSNANWISMTIVD